MKTTTTSQIPETQPEDKLIITGAREHNLQNISVQMPQNQLVVITGLSGSGKSSLAFNTIYAEGQRRYMETFSSYARQFIGNLDHPDVDKISGLNPVISIEQKTVNKNPRSTVGTITEVYDFLRLLFARVADAYSLATNEKMVRYSENEIVQLLFEKFENKNITLLAPIVKGRKGLHKEVFDNLRRQCFAEVRVNGKILPLHQIIKLDRYKIHDIEVVIDKLVIRRTDKHRLLNSLRLAMRHGKGSLYVLDPETDKISKYSQFLMCPTTGISYSEPEPNTFSFNSPYGACPRCNGLGYISEIDIKKIIPDPTLSIKDGGIAILGKYRKTNAFEQLEQLAKKYNFSLSQPIETLPGEILYIILYGSNEILEIKYEKLGLSSRYVQFEGVINFINNFEVENMPPQLRKWVSQFIGEQECPTCHGTRLKEEALCFKIGGKNISELANMDISELYHWVEECPNFLNERQNIIAAEILKELRNRLGFLVDVGIEYLSLNRSSMSLSGGEAQRIRLATQIGSQLVNVLYILDEPSIGLHQRDNQRLINSLKQLRDSGNSIIVVEHDQEIMEQADFIVDIGPGAGKDGGKIIAAGTFNDILQTDSLTADYLSGRREIAIPKRRSGNGKNLTLYGASGNNLQNITVKFPLGCFICVTGVSGSGKSTLINGTLAPILHAHFYRAEKKPMPYEKITGLKDIDKVITINQQPIGRTPRSNPATYIGIFDDIRKLFASMPESQIRGYQANRFSFNVKAGRCENCKGAGVKTIEMNFLPDVYVTCEVCHGKRYNDETLEVRYRGKSINDVLEMDFATALDFFQNIPSIADKLRAVVDVGLGYVRLGQPSTTLSGGEAQRVKLATELSKRNTGNTFYILDEPTTGLHFHDIAMLLNILQKLVDLGNTVLVIEHNMDVIKVADWVIDLGPEGGKGGGQVVATGTPEAVVQRGIGYTAKFLKKSLSSTQATSD